MTGNNPRSTARIGGHPLHPLLIPFPIVCFIGALVTDVMFLTAREGGWATASNWLLGVGLVTAALAAAAGMSDYLGDERVRRIGSATRHMIANVVVMTLEAVNLLIRLTAGADQIRGAGVWLSLAAVAILVYSGWLGGDLVYRHGVGVRDSVDGPGLDPDPDRAPTRVLDGKLSRDRR